MGIPLLLIGPGPEQQQLGQLVNSLNAHPHGGEVGGVAPGSWPFPGMATVSEPLFLFLFCF